MVALVISSRKKSRNIILLTSARTESHCSNKIQNESVGLCTCTGTVHMCTVHYQESRQANEVVMIRNTSGTVLNKSEFNQSQEETLLMENVGQF